MEDPTTRLASSLRPKQGVIRVPRRRHSPPPASRKPGRASPSTRASRACRTWLKAPLLGEMAPPATKSPAILGVALRGIGVVLSGKAVQCAMALALIRDAPSEFEEITQR